MKKFIAVTVIAEMLFSVITGCKNESKKEETTTAVMAIEETNFETTTELQTEAEILTENTTEHTEDEIFVIDKGRHKFYLEKTDYEKRYSSEVLNEIYEMIPVYFCLTFGCDDYDNWNGTPDEVLNDVYHSLGFWAIESYDYDTDEHKRAVEELNSNPYGNENREGFFTSVEKINSYLRDVYGPDARVFKAEDFYTYDEIKTSEESVFCNYDGGFRFVYLPESEIVCCLARETWGGETEDICVCDIRMSNGDYIVEVVLETYNIYCVKYIMTMSCEANGNIYVKSVEDFYVLPDGVENNIKVVSEYANVEIKKYDSGDWIIVDSLSAEDEAYTSERINLYSDDEYIWIVTEEYRGRIEKKYLEPIK